MRAAAVAFKIMSASAVVLVCGGCGYSTGSLMPAGVRSIAVPMATNQTFYRGDEFIYTRYVTQEIMRKTCVQIRECRNADAILHVDIRRLRRVPLVEGRDDIVLEEGFAGEIEATLTERTSGRIIASFKIERRSEAILPRGDTLARERDRLMRDLAEDTVIRLQDESFLRCRGY